MGVVRARRVADDDAFRLRRAPDAQPDRAVAADVARLYRPAAWHDAMARHGGLRQRRELSAWLARPRVRAPASARRPRDRKSAGYGKRVSLRVSAGVGGSIPTKK